MLWMYRNLDSLCVSGFFAIRMEWKAFLVVNEESHESCTEHILIYWCWGKLLSCTCTHRGLMEGGYRSGMLAERWRMWCQGCMWSSSCGITKVTILPCPKMPPGGLACLKLQLWNCGKISFILSSSSLVYLSLPHFLCLGQYCGGSKFLRVNHLLPCVFLNIVFPKFTCCSEPFCLSMKEWMCDALLTSWRVTKHETTQLLQW